MSMSISATCSSDASPSAFNPIQAQVEAAESVEAAREESQNQWNPSSTSSDPNPIPIPSNTTFPIPIPTSTSSSSSPSPGSTITHPTLPATSAPAAATVATATSLILLNLLSSQAVHQRRHSYSAPSTLLQNKQVRSAQLNLLAQQANLASTGASSLRDANTVNLVLGAAVAMAAQRRASLGNGLKQSKSKSIQHDNGDIHNHSDADEHASDEQEINHQHLHQGSFHPARLTKRQRTGRNNSFSNSSPNSNPNSISSTSSINHFHFNPRAFEKDPSAKQSQSSKRTREYSERLSKTFGDIGVDGSNFLNLAGQVARDYATFYKAEREWTGRALRRQSKEEEESQVELGLKLRKVSSHPALGEVGSSPSLSQVEVDETGIVDKGKKRDLEKREDFLSSEDSSTPFLSIEEASQNKRRKLPGSQLEAKSTSSFDPSSSSSNSTSDGQTLITSLNSTELSKSISSSAHSNQAEIPSSSSSDRAAFFFQTKSVNPTISLTPPSNDASPIPISIPSFEASGSSSDSYDSNLTMRKSRGQEEISSTNPTPIPTSDPSSSFNQSSANSQSCLIKSVQIQAFNTHSHNSPPRLTSVLSNFATLLESRQESCQGLESLVAESLDLFPLPPKTGRFP